MNRLTRWLTNSGCIAQALSTSTHKPTVCQTTTKATPQLLQSDLCATAAKDHPKHRRLLPKLDILAVDQDEELQEEREAEDDVKGGPWDPHEVKIARQKELQYFLDRKVYEYSTEAESRTRTARNPVGLKLIGVYEGAPQRGRTDLLGNTSLGNSTGSIRCRVSGGRVAS